jgi:hypothetical protein
VRVRWVLTLIVLSACDRVLGLEKNVDARAIDAPVAYVAAVLADQPIAYWRLGAASQSVVVDETPNGNQGTFAGGVVPGESGPLVDDPDTAMRFDGVDDFVLIGDRLEFPGLAPFSFELWVKPANHNTAYTGVLSKTDELAGGNTKSGFLIFDHFARFGAERNAGATAQNVQTTAALPVDVWTYVVVTFDGSTLTLYLDGESQATNSTPVSVPSTTNGFVIGARNGGEYLRYPGVIDEVAVYDHALPPGRVEAHRRAALSP